MIVTGGHGIALFDQPLGKGAPSSIVGLSAGMRISIANGSSLLWDFVA